MMDGMLNRRWWLLKKHLLWRFADRLFLLLLLVGFDFYRRRIGVGRNYRRSACRGHFRCGWNNWYHSMVK